MKNGKHRYGYALQFCRARLTQDEEISMKSPLVLEAASRFQLHVSQVRKLVSQLRKERP